MYKFIVGLLVVAALSPFISYAALTDEQISSVTGLVRSFGADDVTAQNIYIALRGGTVLGATTDTYPAYCPKLSLSLRRGVRDAETNGQVTELQKFLSGYYDLNPADVVTGYFGPTTHRLVVRFQTEQGLIAQGFVGPQTRTKIAALCVGGSIEAPVTPSPLTPISPGAICPMIAWTPIECASGTLTPRYDANGCQNGWQCVPAPTTPVSIYLKGPANNSTFTIGSPIPIAWSLTGAPSTASQVLLHLKGEQTSGGVGGGVWVGPKLTPGSSTGTYSWLTGTGYLDATGSYSITPYIVACEPTGCGTNYDSQGGLGRQRYAFGNTAYINMVRQATTTTTNTATSLKSYPTIVIDNSLSAGGLADGRLMRFSIRANSTGNIGLTQLFLIVAPSNVSVSNVNVYAYTDSSYSSPISGVSPSGALRSADECPTGCTSNNTANIGITTSGGVLTAIQIPAGATRYFEVRGTVTGAQSGASVTTKLAGDGVFSGPTSATSFVGKDAYFIWSPNTVSTAVRSDSDWYTGYGVPGLPSNGLTYTRGSGVTVDPQPFVSFTATPTTITLGQSSTLSWASGGTSNGGCYIFNGSGGSSIIPFSTTSGSGNISVSPTVTTTYRLWCTSNWKDGSPSAEKSVTVTVTTPPPPTGPAAPSSWKSYNFSTSGTVPCISTSKYVGYSAKYGAWVGALLCGSNTKYKLYMSKTETGTYYQIADYAGHGQDQCELVNPNFSIPNEDDITSGGCSTCLLGSLVDVQNEQVFARARFGEVFKFVTSVFWGDLTTNSYSCGVPIGTYLPPTPVPTAPVPTTSVTNVPEL